MKLPCSRLLLRIALASATLAATATQAAVPAPQRQYLLDFYVATNGAGWTTSTNWNGAPGTECTWYGVTCDGGQNTVTTLNLPSNNLMGTLPDWSALPDLQQIGLATNALTGAVPAISGLASLVTFDVSFNQLSGSLPSPVGLGQLQNYYAFGNQFTGAIPALAGAPALLRFRAYNNQLTGAIPALAGTNLVDIVLNSNQLTGSIPPLPASLTILRVENNQLSGPVPLAPPALAVGASTLCANNITPSVDAAWDKASTVTPWYTGCGTLPPAPGGATSIPTLSEWGLILMSLAAAAWGMATLRRRSHL
ncbi:IPTL-CTERM sorting domain-containing protein [Acidovorax kalamii]|uniref:Uncharacterized protein n=1 Tax=Acidovorax kalamii TaxID=2004485 RepID=A0A235EGZ6_9BURK|nr:IPTL-CTERM sorting domain-containing protein [Acidovorax kalamii]OYD48316.1 hypothetical protein CBY09_20000 [Acidovorax kalamii]